MNRICELFSQKGKNVLSVYFTAGYPTTDSTVEVIRALSDGGVDMAEIGVPFSDPVADGPVIQNSNHVALGNGMTMSLLFSQLRNIRQITRMPLIIMTYLNPVIQYGFEKFCTDASACGVDGFIIPDMPINEYLKDYKETATRYGLENILMITPQTPDERIRMIDGQCNSFIYMVSTAATTGARSSFSDKSEEYFMRIKSMKLRNPVMAGFGISNKTTFDSVCKHVSGAIIGSAFINLLKENPTPNESVKQLINNIFND